MTTIAPVKVAKLGSSKKEVELVATTTVRDVLKIAGIDPGRHQVMINGKESKIDDIVEPGDLVALIPEIRGGE